jgi:signal transduction histidine kinase
MRVSLRTKQVAGVTALVGLSMIVLSAFYLSSLARVGLEESQARGEMLARAIFQRARDAVSSAPDPYAALRTDPGIRSMLESSIAYGRSVTYAAIVDPAGKAVAHSFPGLEGERLDPQDDLSGILDRGAWHLLRAIYADRTLEVAEPLQLGDAPFGAIRIGLSPVLIRDDLSKALLPIVWTTVLVLAVATLVALVLAQWMLQPIHLISSGLTRLGRGELGVTLDLPPEEDFRDLGQSFKAISAQLAERSQAGPLTRLESVVERLEDAVAILDSDGALLFANSTLRSTLPASPSRQCFVDGSLPADHPYCRLVADVLKTHRSQGPISVPVVPETTGEDADTGERLITAHAIEDLEHRFVGVMLVARNLAYLSHVQSTVEYSRKLAALGRLLAGVAHEVKNPLNAMNIHLELVRQKLTAAGVATADRTVRRAHGAPATTGSVLGIGQGPVADENGGTSTLTEAEVGANGDRLAAREAMDQAREHVDIIGDDIERLDQVIQGFLKFIRPEELKLEPVELCGLAREVLSLIEPDADRSGVTARCDCPDGLYLQVDATLVRQALLNLALNACQAMPHGGTLTIRGRAGKGKRVIVEVADTGVGILPEHLGRVFDLYYTTKPGGSGIGLSMVYRIVQLHGGEVEVESTPGRGTRFELSLPRA